jgi:hypothetical protein
MLLLLRHPHNFSSLPAHSRWGLFLVCNRLLKYRMYGSHASFHWSSILSPQIQPFCTETLCRQTLCNRLVSPHRRHLLSTLTLQIYIRFCTTSWRSTSPSFTKPRVVLITPCTRYRPILLSHMLPWTSFTCSPSSRYFVVILRCQSCGYTTFLFPLNLIVLTLL